MPENVKESKGDWAGTGLARECHVMDLRMSCLHLSGSQRILHSILAPPREETDKQRDDQQAGGESQHCVGGGMKVFVLEKQYLR